jgi:hypothetical protein
MQDTVNYAVAAALVKTRPPETQPPKQKRVRCGCADCMLVKESVEEICNNARRVETPYCIARDLAVHQIKSTSRLLHKPDLIGIGTPIVVKEPIYPCAIYAPSFKAQSETRPVTSTVPKPLPTEIKYEKKIAGVWAVYTCDYRHKFVAPHEYSKKCPVCYLERHYDDRFVVLGNKPRPYNAFHHIYCKVCGETFVARRGRLQKSVPFTQCGHHATDSAHNIMMTTLRQIYGCDFADHCTDERGAIILSMFIRDKVVSVYSAEHDLAIFMQDGLSQYREYAQDYCRRHKIRYVEMPLVSEERMQLTVIAACNESGYLPEAYAKKADRFVEVLEASRLS